MRSKKVNLILLSIISLLSQNIFAQWTYKTDRKITKDIIINYAVSYQKELTAKEKASPFFIREIIVTLNKNKLIERTFYNDIHETKVKILDYQNNKHYKCSTNGHAYSSYFKNPEIKSTYLNHKTQTIAGIKCDQYTATIKGISFNLFTTKEFGLKFVKDFNAEGLLMEYTIFDKNLGIYTVKATKVTSEKVPESFYSLKNYHVIPENDTCEKCEKIREKRQQEITNLIGTKSPKFRTKTMNGKKLSSKQNLKNKKIMILNFSDLTYSVCKSEIPYLNDLKKSYLNNNQVEFVYFLNNSKKTIKKSAKKHPINWDIVDQDESQYMAAKFKIKNVPTNIIIDQQGKIQFYTSGYKLNTEELMMRKIDELLDQ